MLREERRSVGTLPGDQCFYLAMLRPAFSAFQGSPSFRLIIFDYSFQCSLPLESCFALSPLLPTIIVQPGCLHPDSSRLLSHRMFKQVVSDALCSCSLLPFLFGDYHIAWFLAVFISRGNPTWHCWGRNVAANHNQPGIEAELTTQKMKQTSEIQNKREDLFMALCAI